MEQPSVKPFTLEEAEELVRELHPGTIRGDPGFKTCVVLLVAAFAVGPDAEKLAAFTGYPIDDLLRICRNMRAAGLWADDGVETDHWFEGESINPWILCADTLVADGLLVPKRDQDGRIVYRDGKAVYISRHLSKVQ